MTTGAAARTTEQRKHCSNDAKWDELAWVCVSLVVELCGAWEKEALECRIYPLAPQRQSQWSILNSMGV